MQVWWKSRRIAAAGGIRALAMLVIALAALAPAQARELTVRGTDMGRYGRILLEFDGPTKVTARAGNGVLVLTFGEPATIRAERLERELPGYVAASRRDPDGTALRLALVGRFRPSLLEAGEKVFVDLLPEGWTGLPPSLPPDVVADLARRAYAAEAKVREESVRRTAQARKPLPVRVAQLPTLTRLVFEPSGQPPMRFTGSEDEASLVIDAPLDLDQTLAAGRLKGVVQSLTGQPDGGSLTVRIKAEPGHEIRGFREDTGFVVDILPIRAAEAAPQDPVSAEARQAAAEEEKAGAKAAAAEAAAAGKPAAASPQAAGAPPRPEPAPKSPPAAMPARETTGRTGEPAGSPAAISAPQPNEVQAPARIVMPPPAPPPAPVQSGPIRPSVEVSAKGLSLTFPFAGRTAAAAFEHAGMVTAVFQTAQAIDLASLPAGADRTASIGSIGREGPFAVLRLRLARQSLVHFTPKGEAWVLAIGEDPAAASEPLAVSRSIGEDGRTLVTVPFADAAGVHWSTDPTTRERLAVVTAFGPARGLPKPHRFVEFRLLPTAHGVVVAADADDVVVRSDVDGAVIGRPAGLSVSLTDAQEPRLGTGGNEPVIVRERWNQDRLGAVLERYRDLLHKAAASPQHERGAVRLELARFLLANRLNAEAASVLAFAVQDDPSLGRRREVALMRGIAAAGMERNQEARQHLGAEDLAEDPEAVLWRAVLDARARRWPAALAGFRRTASLLDVYPEDLQATIRPLAARAAIAAKEPALAGRQLDLLVGLSDAPALREELALLRASLDEALGQEDAALEGYRALSQATSRPIAAEATLHAVRLGLPGGSVSPEEAIRLLETLALTWRGDEKEIEALGQLGALYADTGRWREAFMTARHANRLSPDHPVTQRLHENTAKLFEDLFLTGKGATLSRVDALALYFDFKELTPIGRRGDEIVRRLADRLVELDLLENAGDLLQHQVDNRLDGAARATVAARLATIRLMDSRPAEALAVLGATRLAELPATIHRARMLLEARALSDLSRTDLALEILQGETGAEVDRLKADILWSGRRWREAGEAHEQLVGTRWQGPEPLSDQDRTDVIRAAIAYGLSDEAIGLDRLRTKFARKMADSLDAQTFAFLTRPNISTTRAFREMARQVTSADTLADFLAAYRKRYPEAAAAERPRRTPDTQPPSAAPEANAAAEGQPSRS